MNPIQIDISAILIRAKTDQKFAQFLNSKPLNSLSNITTSAASTATLFSETSTTTIYTQQRQTQIEDAWNRHVENLRIMHETDESLVTDASVPPSLSMMSSVIADDVIQKLVDADDFNDGRPIQGQIMSVGSSGGVVFVSLPENSLIGVNNNTVAKSAEKNEHAPPVGASPRKDSGIDLDDVRRLSENQIPKFYFPLGDPSSLRRSITHRSKKLALSRNIGRLGGKSRLSDEMTLGGATTFEEEDEDEISSSIDNDDVINENKEDDDVTTDGESESSLPYQKRPTSEILELAKKCFHASREDRKYCKTPLRAANTLYRDEMWPVALALGVPQYTSTTLFDRAFEERMKRRKPDAASTIMEFAEGITQEHTVATMIAENIGGSDGDGGIGESNEEKFIEFEDLERWWVASFAQSYHDEHAIVFKIMLKNKEQLFLTPFDFKTVVDEVVQKHPGLQFLSTLPLFQSRYGNGIHSSIERMTLAEFRKHAFVELLINLQFNNDINVSRDIFSYKHFYVIYCKFWELDSDHDMIIEASDMSAYDRGSLTSLMMSRVVTGYGKPLSLGTQSLQISYKDFIWFILSVEDKQHHTSIDYWFRCLDLDCDGKLSLHELKEFYDEQAERMIDFRVNEPWKFDDLVCSLLDLIKPKNGTYITPADLKRSPSNASLFFDILFDLRKYDNYIRRIDPHYRELDDIWAEEIVGSGLFGRRVKLEGWDKFAERAYDMLAYEESEGMNISSANFNEREIGENDEYDDDNVEALHEERDNNEVEMDGNWSYRFPRVNACLDGVNTVDEEEIIEAW
ncbi:Serine/threonine-protein phosphatase 2A regulatory subunit B'' subunit alpha [Physocladia obscura]|uniref:Serine/threonine-protein phosphatase 2A regulatory subunit B'' subunit alpha n=1 Tax=Physocladia obscura TaxID=109957 RepID=A0AAD5TDE7_9FUNG|nr:Serine/threonine-protein phosphatase 2A regulatory subunit B'' subunit alpha [Physocladia obscura]